MNIFIYADESGVFDVVHNDYYVFAWVICIGKENKETWNRKFGNVERSLCCKGYDKCIELKAINLKPKDKMGIYRSLNGLIRGSVVIDQKNVFDHIFTNKKSKQRYLDYAFKVGVKKHIASLFKQGVLNKDEIDNIYFFLDEHTTATNGRYELREGLLEEFKNGTYNNNYTVFHEPILPNLIDLQLKHVDSKTTKLVRAADIIANITLYKVKNNKLNDLKGRQFIYRLP